MASNLDVEMTQASPLPQSSDAPSAKVPETQQPSNTEETAQSAPPARTLSSTPPLADASMEAASTGVPTSESSVGGSPDSEAADRPQDHPNAQTPPAPAAGALSSTPMETTGTDIPTPGPSVGGSPELDEDRPQVALRRQLEQDSEGEESRPLRKPENGQASQNSGAHEEEEEVMDLLEVGENNKPTTVKFGNFATTKITDGNFRPSSENVSQSQGLFAIATMT